MSLEVKEWHTLDWCDGPLLEAGLCEPRHDKPEYDLVEFRAIGDWVEVGGVRFEVPGDVREQTTHIRLSRENLQAALDLLDGKRPKNWDD